MDVCRLALTWVCKVVVVECGLHSLPFPWLLDRRCIRNLRAPPPPSSCLVSLLACCPVSHEGTFSLAPHSNCFYWSAAFSSSFFCFCSFPSLPPPLVVLKACSARLYIFVFPCQLVLFESSFLLIDDIVWLSVPVCTPAGLVLGFSHFLAHLADHRGQL